MLCTLNSHKNCICNKQFQYGYSHTVKYYLSLSNTHLCTPPITVPPPHTLTSPTTTPPPHTHSPLHSSHHCLSPSHTLTSALPHYCPSPSHTLTSALPHHCPSPHTLTSPTTTPPPHTHSPLHSSHHCPSPSHTLTSALPHHCPSPSHTHLCTPPPPSHTHLCTPPTTTAPPLHTHSPLHSPTTAPPLTHSPLHSSHHYCPSPSHTHSPLHSPNHCRLIEVLQRHTLHLRPFRTFETGSALQNTVRDNENT